MTTSIDVEIARAYYNKTNTSNTSWEELPHSLKTKFIDMVIFVRIYLITKEVVHHELNTGPEVA